MRNLVKSHSSSKLSMKLSGNVTNQSKKFAMDRERKFARLFMSHPAARNMLRNNLESLLETPLVRNFPLKFVEQAEMSMCQVVKEIDFSLT